MKTNGRRKVKFLSREEGRKLLDKQARHYLRMSGEEFIRKQVIRNSKTPTDLKSCRSLSCYPLAGKSPHQAVRNFLKPLSLAALAELSREGESLDYVRGRLTTGNVELTREKLESLQHKADTK